MSKKIKQNEQSATYQYTVTGHIDVYVNGRFILTCFPADIQSQQVQYLIKNNHVQKKRQRPKKTQL